jgi:uncharacterized coiled-coil protein SlyX
MVYFRQRLIRFLITATLIASGVFPQTNLSQILDTITNPDGTPFNGTVVITWNGYSGTGSGTVSRLSTSARVYNGALSVLLVPTTTASPGTYYQVVYTSSNGVASWTETWQVPPSTTALTLAQVRISSTEGSGSGSGSGSGAGSSGTYATLPIAISQVTNLASSLSSINTALTTVQTNDTGLTTTVNGLGTTVGALNTTVTGMNTTLNTLGTTVTGQSTTIAGLNTTVTGQGTTLTNLGNTVAGLNTTLTSQGSSLSSLNSTVTGLSSTVTTQGTTISGLNTSLGSLNTTVASNGAAITNLTTNLGSLTTAVAGNTSSIGTVSSSVGGITTNVTNLTNSVNGLNATVNSLSAAGSTAVFIDSEVPSGSVNGTNATFSLANTPAPATSLTVFRNGIATAPGIDYTLNGSVITFLAAALPQTTDKIFAYYRMAGTGATTNFVDNETPGGAVNTTNVTFSLASAPNPSSSLRLFRNGVLAAPGGDYTLSGSAITFATGSTPRAGDSLAAYYRH